MNISVRVRGGPVLQLLLSSKTVEAHLTEEWQGAHDVQGSG